MWVGGWVGLGFYLCPPPPLALCSESRLFDVASGSMLLPGGSGSAPAHHLPGLLSSVGGSGSGSGAIGGGSLGLPGGATHRTGTTRWPVEHSGPLEVMSEDEECPPPAPGDARGHKQGLYKQAAGGGASK